MATRGFSKQCKPRPPACPARTHDGMHRTAQSMAPMPAWRTANRRTPVYLCPAKAGPRRTSPRPHRELLHRWRLHEDHGGEHPQHLGGPSMAPKHGGTAPRLTRALPGDLETAPGAAARRRPRSRTRGKSSSPGHEGAPSAASSASGAALEKGQPQQRAASAALYPQLHAA